MKIKYRFFLPVAIAVLVLFGMVKATESAGLADSAWPCKGHDSRRTGRSPYIGAQTDNLKWANQPWYHPFGYPSIKSSPVIGIDGTIYVGSLYGGLFAFYPDGSLKWNYKTGVGESSPAIGIDGTIYVGANVEYLYALDKDGNMKWNYQTGGEICSSPAIGSDGTIYIGSSDRKIYAFNPDGSLKWRYLTNGSLSSPTIGNDGTVYIASSTASTEGKVYAFTPSGRLLWSYQTWDEIQASPSIGDDGTIYIGVWFTHHLYAFYPNGRVKWKFASDSGIKSTPAIGSDGTIYVGSVGGNLYAINPANGSLKWSYQTGNSVNSSPAIGSDGIIYVGNGDGRIFAIDPNGSLLWSYRIPTWNSFQSSPAIGADGTVYIGSGGTDGKLYAFGEEPTLIELDQFSAVSQANLITITWNTLSEIDNAGFNLWRNSKNGPYIKINSVPIESEGGVTMSAKYSFIDDTAIPGGTYYYKLEDIDNSGGSTFHRPVSATIPVIKLIPLWPLRYNS